jgi:hypothetical protein
VDFVSYPQARGGPRPGPAGARRSLAMDATELLSIDCPRCGASVDERYYGPCSPCRDALRAELGGAAREVEAVAYEPKMNVTPNAVALKDD